MTGDGPAATDPPRPADGLLHPVVLGALLVLVVNDQLLKAVAPGPLTWILSDAAGLIVAPAAILGGWEAMRWAIGRWHGPSRAALLASIAVVGIGFVAVQLWPSATDAYREGLGLVQWPFRAAAAAAQGRPLPAAAPVEAVGDVYDLLALPALAVTWLLGRRRLAWADRPVDRAA